MLSVSSLYKTGWEYDWHIRKDSDRSVHELIKVYPDIFLEGRTKTTKTSVSIASVPAKIQIEHLQNTSIQLNCCTIVWSWHSCIDFKKWWDEHLPTKSLQPLWQVIYRPIEPVHRCICLWDILKFMLSVSTSSCQKQKHCTLLWSYSDQRKHFT